LFAGPDEAIITTGDGSMFAIRIGEDELERFEGRHQAAINSLLATNDGKTVVTSSDDEKIMMWDLGVRRRIAVFDAHPGYLFQLSHSDQRALMLTRAGVLKIISLRDGTLLAAFQADKIITTCGADVELRWVVACDQGGAIHFLHFEGKT
jgi:WD40 repeat protein